MQRVKRLYRLHIYPSTIRPLRYLPPSASTSHCRSPALLLLFLLPRLRSFFSIRKGRVRPHTSELCGAPVRETILPMLAPRRKTGEKEWVERDNRRRARDDGRRRSSERKREDYRFLDSPSSLEEREREKEEAEKENEKEEEEKKNPRARENYSKFLTHLSSLFFHFFFLFFSEPPTSSGRGRVYGTLRARRRVPGPGARQTHGSKEIGCSLVF